MPLSRVQKVVVRNALKFAKKLKVCEGLLYIQIPPSMNEFNAHLSKSIEIRNREVLQDVYPPELHELIDQYPSRVLDGETLRRFVCSAARLRRFESELSSDRLVNEDMALEAVRRLSEQRKLLRTTSLATTGAVHISASSICADTDNNTGQDGYLHFYRVTITNTGNEVVQVIGRQWKIESLGETEDIQRVPAFSPGLIGLKPVLEPGQMFEYTSCVTVKYKQGIMEGSLLLINKSTGDAFEAVVNPFLLLR